jgi:hypothetical protein
MNAQPRYAIASSRYSKLAYVEGRGLITRDEATTDLNLILVDELEAATLGVLPGASTPETGKGLATAKPPRKPIARADFDLDDAPIPKPKKGEAATWHPVLGFACALPCGRVVLATAAEERGWSINGERRPSKVYESMRLGLTGSLATEHARSLEIAERLVGETSREQSYATIIMSLPESADRPLAAAQIAAAYSAASMPPAKAARFLAALPSETASDAGALSYERREVNDRRLELLEIGFSRMAGMGNADAQEQLATIGYAKQIARSGAMSLRQALSVCGFDLTKLEP